MKNIENYKKSLDNVKPDEKLVNETIQKIREMKIQKAQTSNQETQSVKNKLQFNKLKLIRTLSIGVAATFVISITGTQLIKINNNKVSNVENQSFKVAEQLCARKIENSTKEEILNQIFEKYDINTFKNVTISAGLDETGCYNQWGTYKNSSMANEIINYLYKLNGEIYVLDEESDVIIQKNITIIDSVVSYDIRGIDRYSINVPNSINGVIILQLCFMDNQNREFDETYLITLTKEDAETLEALKSFGNKMLNEKLSINGYTNGEITYNLNNTTQSKNGICTTEDIQKIIQIFNEQNFYYYVTDEFPEEKINKNEYTLINLKNTDNNTCLMYVPKLIQNPIIITCNGFRTGYIIDVSKNAEMINNLQKIIQDVCQGLKEGDTTEYIKNSNELVKKKAYVNENVVAIRTDDSLSIRFNLENFKGIDVSKIDENVEYIVKNNVKDFVYTLIGNQNWPVVFYLLSDGTVEYIKMEEAVTNGNCSVVHKVEGVTGVNKIEVGQGTLREAEFGYITIFATKSDGSRVELILNELFNKQIKNI